MTGPELRERRKALALTQTQLAARLGLPQPNVARWESGAVAITAMRAAWLREQLARIERR